MTPFDSPKLMDDLPRYPPLLQLIRVTAAVVSGPSGVTQVAGSSVLAPILYVAFVQQSRTDGSLLPRDREPCLADDVNGLGLSPGFYLGRLANTWTSLPVYEVIGNAVGSSTAFDHWVLITEVNGTKAAGIEVTPQGGGSYSATPGGRVHGINNQPLYEENDIAGAPVGAVVWVWRGAEGSDGREWIYYWHMMPAIISEVHDEENPIRYICQEQTMTAGALSPKSGARTFERCFERNNNTVNVGKKIWLYRGHTTSITGAIRDLWFDFEPPPVPAIVNVPDITLYTASPGDYYNVYNGILYKWIDGVGFYPMCCPGVPIGGGSSSSGTGGGGLLTACCPSSSIPLTLSGAISNKTGDTAECLPATSCSFTNTSPGPPATWSSNELSAPCFGGGTGTQTFTFQCNPGAAGAVGAGWILSNTNVTSADFYVSLVSESCNPFQVVLDVTVVCYNFPSCTKSGTFRITITG